MSERTATEALEIIKKAENEIIRLETQYDSALTTLKETYKINSIEEGDSYLEKKELELEELEKNLEAKKKTLQEDFPWE